MLEIQVLLKEVKDLKAKMKAEFNKKEIIPHTQSRQSINQQFYSNKCMSIPCKYKNKIT